MLCHPITELLGATSNTGEGKWERDVGQLDGEQWEEIFQGVSICSLNVAQRLTQLYIIFRVYYTPHRLQLMGMQNEDTCTRCERDHGDLIPLLWRCPKLHKYWAEVVSTVNSVFGVSIPVDPRLCLLGVLGEYVVEVYTRDAVHRVLFQARKLIMFYWKSENPQSSREWIVKIRDMLRMEKLIYQHRGSTRKYENLWAPWLDAPGLSSVDLVMDKLLGLNVA